MSDSSTSKGTAEVPKLEQYNKVKNDIIREILKKQELTRQLGLLEDSIYNRENDYFEESVYGNIVKGFDNFNKSNSGSSNKKKLSYTDEDHIFSMSSVNYYKELNKRQELVNGEYRGDDLDDYEDTVESSGTTSNGNGSTPAQSTDVSSSGRKRKTRTYD